MLCMPYELLLAISSSGSTFLSLRKSRASAGEKRVFLGKNHRRNLHTDRTLYVDLTVTSVTFHFSIYAMSKVSTTNQGFLLEADLI